MRFSVMTHSVIVALVVISGSCEGIGSHRFVVARVLTGISRRGFRSEEVHHVKGRTFVTRHVPDKVCVVSALGARQNLGESCHLGV